MARVVVAATDARLEVAGTVFGAVAGGAVAGEGVAGVGVVGAGVAGTGVAGAAVAGAAVRGGRVAVVGGIVRVAVVGGARVRSGREGVATVEDGTSRFVVGVAGVVRCASVVSVVVGAALVGAGTTVVGDPAGSSLRITSSGSTRAYAVVTDAAVCSTPSGFRLHAEATRVANASPHTRRVAEAAR